MVTEEKFGNDFDNMVLFASLGGMMALSYGYYQKVLVFKILIIICEYLSFPSSKKMAIVYSLLFFVISSYYLYLFLFVEPM